MNPVLRRASYFNFEGGIRFESWSGHRLSWSVIFTVFSCLEEMSEEYLDIGHHSFHSSPLLITVCNHPLIPFDYIFDTLPL